MGRSGKKHAGHRQASCLLRSQRASGLYALTAHGAELTGSPLVHRAGEEFGEGEASIHCVLCPYGPIILGSNKFW